VAVEEGCVDIAKVAASDGVTEIVPDDVGVSPPNVACIFAEPTKSPVKVALPPEAERSPVNIPPEIFCSDHVELSFLLKLLN